MEEKVFVSLQSTHQGWRGQYKNELKNTKWTISRLIEELEAIYEDYGDIPVGITVTNNFSDDYEEIGFVGVEDFEEEEDEE